MARAVLAQETVFALRETIAKLEGKAVPSMAAARQDAYPAEERAHRLSLGVEALDEALEGGLPLEGITEIRSQGFRDAGASSGFALALSGLMQERGATGPAPFLWIADRMSAMEAGSPYPLGLRQFGLDIARFLVARPDRLEDALWLAEAALASGIFGTTILEIRGNPKAFGLTESRRLHLRAKAAGRPLLLLRHAGEEEASSALFRFLLEPFPARARLLPDGSMLGGSIGHSVFRLTLEKSRNPAPLSFLLEWNPHDRQFRDLSSAEQPLLREDRPAHSGRSLSKAGDRQDIAPLLGAVLAFDRAS
ncbi:ImuA family protein [Rhizobium oryzicola]|uniref:Protein ImuA n=1 Tax=Rhizobium oryzicola TaxID=1232668 RepID=A0ABT8T313_9HYPH|nr:hypothetical protein [Rhizobium oryzicola]MDO1584794.1 hypothetical protein [Rhizobium oryzicola]